VIVQLYIQGERVDMFEEESISISDSIQNVKDIQKVFTSFSRTFSIPASKENNKIFKHYYNSDIDNGFDARIRKKATIEVNNMPFKTGFIQLEGVDLKNNIAYKYRVTFFGDILSLKDSIGEDKLGDLDFPSDYNKEFSPSQIKDWLSFYAQSANNNVIVPLITHSQELYYDSLEQEPPADGNLYWHTGSGTHIHGVKWNELKYAIRVNKIIEAIEDKYQLQFSSDFFKNTSIEDFDHLFLWLHRKSGKVENLNNEATTKYVDEWTNNPPSSIVYFRNGVFTCNILEDDIDVFRLTFTPSSNDSSKEYAVRIERNGQVDYYSQGNTGTLILNAGNNEDFTYGTGFSNYKIFIISEAMTFDSIVLDVEAEDALTLGDVDVTYSTGTVVIGSEFEFVISQQMPDIKILDFITGLFKSFNLTAYVENDIIVVKPLNDFYDSGKGATSATSGWDITEYIDVAESSVNASTIYKDVIFKFKDTKTILANKYGEINNKTWGEQSYKIEQENLASNKTYKIEPPFGKMMYEKMTDRADNSATNIQWGYSVDKSQNAYLGSPLLFYPVYVAFPSYASFIDEVDPVTNEAESKVQISGANLPSNSPSLNSSTNAFQFSFNNEINEYSLNASFDKTLFTEYYEDYIEGVFNKKNRLTKVSAYLPLNIILNYSLADRFIIKDKSYKINSIDTDFKTGKSEIELIGDF